MKRSLWKWVSLGVYRLPSTSRQTKAKVVLAIVFVSTFSGAGFVFAETFLSTYYSTTGPIHYNASDGPEVVQPDDYNLRSGNPFTDKSFNLSTENNGWINVSTSDPDSSAMVVQIDKIEGDRTVASGITATSGNITLNPRDKNQTTVGGGIDSIAFNETGVNDGEVDFNYTASSTGTIIVETNATDGTAYGMVDPQTEEGLDVAVADSGGKIHFTDVPSRTSDQEVRIEKLGTLTIREETPPHDVITNADATIQFYEATETDPVIIQRTTSNGKVDLTGLPVDETFVATIDAPGYYNTTVVIEDLSQQDNAFMLNRSADSYQMVFDLNDPTGQYERSDTVLYIQRAINLSNVRKWRAARGDFFGAEGVPATLEADQRYRLVIENLNTGDRAVLGAFTPVQSRTVTLEPAAANIELSAESDTAIAYNASLNQTSKAILVKYNDPADRTDELLFNIHERNNDSNVLLTNQSFTNLGSLSYAEPLSNQEQNTSWAVNFYWDRGDGFESTTVYVGQGPRDIIPDELDAVYQVSVGVLILLITALLFSQLNNGVGAVTTAIAGGVLWYIGFLDGVTTGPAVVVALAIAGTIHYSQRGGP